ncbi:MAG: LamG-like jellyroll fold domain-containing protein [Pyrinomonadaceae bacterium]
MYKRRIFQILFSFFWGLAAAGIALSQCTAPPSGIISWYKADGSPQDERRINGGILMNGVTYAPGMAGSAFQLDGVDDYVLVVDSPSLDFDSADQMSILMWVKLSDTGIYHILGKRSNCGDSGQSANYLIANDSRGLLFTSAGQLLLANETLPIDEWKHVAVTADGTTIRIYIDGVEKNSISAQLGAPNNVNMEIGGNCGGFLPFPGLIDDVVVLRRAASQAELTAIVTAGPNGICADCNQNTDGLAHWWRGDFTALDSRGLAQGVMQNGAYFSRGVANAGFYFDGENDQAEVASGLGDPGINPFTATFWVNPEDYTVSEGYLIGKSNPDGGIGWDIRLDSAGKIRIAGVDGWGFNIVGATKLKRETWHHVAVVSDGTTTELYIDGILDGGSGRSAITTTTNPLRFGFTTEYQGSHFFGTLDDIRFYERALTETEISGLYESGAEGGCITKCADFDGDGRTDISVFRPGEGKWYVDASTDGFDSAKWGVHTDTPIAGDFDGDGKTDFAVFRPTDDGATPDFWVLQSSDSTILGVAWGSPNDTPVIGDYDFDNRDDFAVFRQTDTNWYIHRSSDAGVMVFQFGLPGDMPLAGDWDGDGLIRPSVYRPSNGTWYLARTDGLPATDFDAIPFGVFSDLPLPGDYDGDGKTDIAVWRASTGTWWYMASSDGQVSNVQFGRTGDLPAPGDYDGDGITDPAIYRGGQWWVANSNGPVSVDFFGVTGDIPVPRLDSE